MAEEPFEQVEEIYKNLLYETEINVRIVIPSTGVRMCESPFHVSYFNSIQDRLALLPEELRDALRSMYQKMEEENMYISRLKQMGYDGYVTEYHDESARWSKLCSALLEEIQNMRLRLKARIDRLEPRDSI